VATFCLLHGAWQDSSCWRLLEQRLEAMGHTTVAPDLPLDDPEAGYLERARPAIEGLEGVDGEVVVVVHSQSSALGPLVVTERPVSVLVYLCPRMGGIDLPEGAPRPFREGFPFPPTGESGSSEWDPAAAIDAMFSRLPPDRAKAMADRLRPMAMPPDGYPLRRHPDVETALIYAAGDEIFEPAFERFVARELLGIDPIEVSGGHFQMVEDPDRLATLFDDIARRGRRPR
jgi:pimeloyl-ACP methyl ester carboxylesterase